MFSDAQWDPLYDLHAHSQDGKPSTSVSLHYRVNLSQWTGEDWNNAKLILSTSETDVLNAGIPKSDCLSIEPKPTSPPPPPPESHRKKRKARDFSSVPTFRARGAPAIQDYDAEFDDDVSLESAPITLLEMSEGGAVISKSPMAVSYTVDELTTIPSDEQSHKVLVAIIPLEASISHITTPRKSPLAYLQVRIECSVSVVPLIIERLLVFRQEHQ